MPPSDDLVRDSAHVAAERLVSPERKFVQTVEDELLTAKEAVGPLSGRVAPGIVTALPADRVLPGIVCVHRQTMGELFGERDLKRVVMGIEVIAVIGDAVGPAALTSPDERIADVIVGVCACWKLPTVVTRQIGLIVRSSRGRNAGYWFTVQRYDAREERARTYRWIEVQGLASDAVLCR